MSSPAEWYQALPPVSKVWLTCAVVSGIAVKLQYIQWPLLAYLPPLIFSRKLQVSATPRLLALSRGG